MKDREDLQLRDIELNIAIILHYQTRLIESLKEELLPANTPEIINLQSQSQLNSNVIKDQRKLVVNGTLT